jgi:hypothetical protein
VNLKVPVRDPAPVGVKITLTLQLAPAATVALQLGVWAKLPLTEIDLMVRLASPVLESVTVCAALAVFKTWLPNVSLVSDKETLGTAPVPLRETRCGLPDPLLVMVKVPVRKPAAAGVKVTVIMQLAPAASVAAQLELRAKLPEMAIALIVRPASPVLESVTVRAELVVRKLWPPKTKLAGATVSTPCGERPDAWATNAVPPKAKLQRSIPTPSLTRDAIRLTPTFATIHLGVFVISRNTLAAPATSAIRK